MLKSHKTLNHSKNKLTNHNDFYENNYLKKKQLYYKIFISNAFLNSDNTFKYVYFFTRCLYMNENYT